jgi:pyrroloquinoline quinone (PQQ) biosynthesis protein C
MPYARDSTPFTMPEPMTTTAASFRIRLRDKLASCYERLPLMQRLADGLLDRDELHQLVINHYCDARAFIDIKLPARMYLCPRDAANGRRYFWHLYEEENGNFGRTPDHAEMFRIVCRDVGVSDERLDTYYELYRKIWLPMFRIEPSYAAMVKELAISFAWENITPKYGDRFVTTFRDRYGVSEQGMRFFSLHNDVDDEHSQHAEDVVVEYASTSPELARIALDAVEEALVGNLYLAWRLDA